MSTQIRVLTVAGSDSGGSAGLQADLKTFEALDVFGMSALTLVTAQNTLGVHAAYALPESLIAQQIEVVLADIGADALKTGLLGRASVVRLVSEAIRGHRIGRVVVDPVLVNGNGELMVSTETLVAYQEELFPLATIITPNLDEAALLAGMRIQDESEVYKAAQKLHGFGIPYIFIKGGHFQSPLQVMDWFYDGKDFTRLTAPRLPIENPHGVGCTLAAALAAELAKGFSPPEAASHAHQYLQGALAASLKRQIGKGRQPVYHAYQP